MIYFRTHAYNAEKTLARTIESILNQTYGEFTYYLLDHGSNDRTGEIIRDYAKRDKRIVPFYNKRNRDYTENPDFWSISHRLQDGDYFCILDADDVYEPTFLEEMLKFLTENELDIAICGSKFIDAATGKVCGEHVMQHDYVLTDAQSFEAYFPVVHWNLRQVWGKLYTPKAARARYEGTEMPEWYPKYGGDTIQVYESVKVSERIGVYAKALHCYTISQGSGSYRWDEGRKTDDFVVFEKAKECLEQKCGGVSGRNLSFLYAVQFNALKDTLRVLYRSDLAPERKISVTKEIFRHPVTKAVFVEETISVTKENKTEFLTGLVCQLIELAQNVDASSLSDVFEIFSSLNVNFPRFIAEESVGWYVKMLPVVIRNIALGEYEYAMNNLIVYLGGDKETKPESDFPFVLGQMLAAMREEEQKYIFFSKKLIHWCIENNQSERARYDLNDWLKILPEDEELKELSKKISALSGVK